MKQLDSRRSPLKSIGAVLQVWSEAWGIVSLLLTMLYLYGFYDLVFRRFLPIWAFMLLIVGALSGIMVLSYKVLIPLKYRWVSHQVYKHDNPLVEEVRALRGEVRDLDRHLKERIILEEKT